MPRNKKRTVNFGIAFWIMVLVINNSILVPKKFYKISQASEFVQNQIQPSQIIIEKIKLSLPLSLGHTKDGYWLLSDDELMYIPSTDLTGTIIYGHNKAKLFKNLSKLNIGDTFSIIDADQQENIFEVYELDTVLPHQVDSLNSEPNQVVLYTCTGAFDSKRLIVKAKPIT